MAAHIGFALNSGIDDDRERAIIIQALSDVPVSRGDRKEEGRWAPGTTSVQVLQKLQGGRSGSMVLLIQAEATDTSLQVAKLMPHDEAVAEWESFRDGMKDRAERFNLYVPVVAVSKSVHQGNPGGFTKRAVVYQHVQDGSAIKNVRVESLEDLVGSAIRGESDVDSARATIEKLMETLRNALFNGAQISKKTGLTEENENLGYDLEIVAYAASYEAGGALTLRWIQPSSQNLLESNVLHPDILESSARPFRSREGLKRGDAVHFWPDDWTYKNMQITARYGPTRLLIHLRGAAEESRGAAVEDALQHGAETESTPSLDLFGQIEVQRTQQWSQLLSDHLSSPGADFVEGGETLRRDGAVVDHPARSLLGVLNSDAARRTTSAVHGDLNPRNIIFCDSAPRLIDYASYRSEGRPLADLAWLEVCLFRDCVASQLSWSEMLTVARLLALLTMCSATWPDDRVEETAARLIQVCRRGSEPMGRCITLLWSIRRAALQLARPTVESAAAEHYFQELTLASCRTLKWPSEQQEPTQVMASAVVAGTASEAIRSGVNGILSNCRPEHARAVRDAFTDSEDHCSWEDLDFILATSKVGGEATLSASDIAPHILSGPLRPLAEKLAAQCEDDKNETPSQYGMGSYIDLAGRVLSPGDPYVQQGEGALALAPESCLELLKQHDAVVVIADFGSGKTAVTREFRARMLQSAMSRASLDRESPRLPLTATAQWLSRELERTPQPSAAQILSALAPTEDLTEKRVQRLLSVGTFHLTVDRLHEVDGEQLRGVAAWLKKVRTLEPQLKIVVCQRALDYQPGLLGWPAIAIHKVRELQVRRYIAQELQHRRPPFRPESVPLEELLFDVPEAVALRDLAGKPLFLAMLVKHYQEHGEVPVNPGVLVHGYVSHLLGAFNSADGSLHPPMRLLKTLVRKMDNNSFLEHSEALTALELLGVSPEGTLASLVDTTAIVSGEHRRITFCNPLVHAYCAADALAEDAREDLPGVEDRILSFSWRDAAVLLVANPDTATTTVAAVLKSAVQASPWYGALLLQAVPNTRSAEFAESHRSFLQAQRDVLQSASSGRPAWQQSAYALAKYGDSEAIEVLGDVACSGGQEEAVVAALDGLVMMSQWFVPHAKDALGQVLQQLLEADTRAPDAVQVRALRSIRTVGLTSLTGYAWSHVAAVRPWAVIHEAWNALGDLKVLPSQKLRAVYAEACKSRLEEVDGSLAQTAATAEASRLNEERMGLLKFCASQGDVSVLLRYRFRAGLAENSAWQRMLDEAAAFRLESSDPDLVAQSLLQPGSPDVWRDQLAVQGDRWAAVIAAHRLLASGEVVGASLLRSISAPPDAERLGLVAAFVHCLQPSDVSGLEALIEPYLVDLDARMVEPLSSLVSAARALDDQAGLRLAVRVNEALIRHGLEEQAVHWPWCTTWRRVLPMRAETGRFLEEKSLDSDTLRCLMGSVDVLLDAPGFKPVSLSEDMRRKLRDLEPPSPDGVEALEYVLIASSAGLYESLDFVQRVATSKRNLQQVITHSHGIHGRVEVSLAAHAVSAVGFLGQLARRMDAGRSEEDVLDSLQQMLSSRNEYHHSVQRARCIALGYWGEWRPLLSTLLWVQDPILERAAVNVVSHWIPQPSDGAAELHVEIAQWISRRLQDGTKLQASTRAVLTEIREGIQNTLRRYVQA
ncbi:hypothetical protein ACIQV1_27400 [Streptomyces rubiginosohelvolus]|uniref:hypothetical protein n=1 Tax=Streptomyces rubiginosohelvolus TaxID=67362 RepID=UPI0037F910FF